MSRIKHGYGVDVRDLKAGDVLTRENVHAIRPGLGMATKYLEQSLGMTVKQDVRRGTVLSFDLLRNKSSLYKGKARSAGEVQSASISIRS